MLSGLALLWKFKFCLILWFLSDTLFSCPYFLTSQGLPTTGICDSAWRLLSTARAGGGGGGRRRRRKGWLKAQVESAGTWSVPALTVQVGWLLWGLQGVPGSLEGLGPADHSSNVFSNTVYWLPGIASEQTGFIKAFVLGLLWGRIKPKMKFDSSLGPAS